MNYIKVIPHNKKDKQKAKKAEAVINWHWGKGLDWSKELDNLLSFERFISKIPINIFPKEEPYARFKGKEAKKSSCKSHKRERRTER